MTFSVPILALLAIVYASGCTPDKEFVDCSSNPTSPVCVDNTKGPAPAKIYIDPPFGVSFSCVLLGCEETLILEVQNRGGGSIALSSTQIENAESTHPLDYSVEIYASREINTEEGAERVESLAASPESPVIVTPEAPVYLHITYKPTDGLDDLATLTIRWFDGKNDYADAEIQEVELSVSARILEAAEATLETTALNFGFSPIETPLTKSIQLANTSATDAILAVLDAQLTPESSDSFQIGVGWTPFVNPQGVIEIPVTFRPTQTGYTRGAVELITNDSVGTYVIPLKGTSIENASLQIIDPPTSILDFNDVRAHESASRMVTLANIGGTATSVTIAFESDQGIFSTNLPEAPLELQAMSELTFEVEVQPTVGGDISGEIVITPDSQETPIRLEMQGFCTAPEIAVSDTLNLAPIVQTWVSETYRLSVTNSGVGELIISDIQFDAGSSSQIQFASSLSLPMSLSPDDPSMEIPIVATGTNLGSLEAALLISHNGIREAVTRIQVRGSVVTCEEGCPTANGTPQCMSGSCEIASCIEGWHDQNTSPGDGCECGEDRDGFDVGGVCSSGADLGNLGDCGSSYAGEATRQGTLHNESDIDLYFVRTEDAGGGCDFFGDSATASVELVDGPPGLALCASIRDEDTGCGGYTSFFDENLCGQNSYERDGSWLADDNQELTAWVLWRPDAAPSCGTYTLKFRGSD